MLSEIINGADEEQLQTSYRYDLRDRLTHAARQGGATTRYLYDKNNQLIKEIQPYGYEADADHGAGTTYCYDCRGNRIAQKNAIGQMVVEQRYNLQNQPVRQTDGMGNETEHDYTLDGKIKESRRGRDGNTRPLQRYEYNTRGQIIGIKDGIGETVSYDLDSWGRITGIGFSDGVKEGYEYTLSGQVSKAVDGNGNAVEYRHNSLEKVCERIDQSGYAEVFEYDEEGNLTLYIDRDGNRVSRVYNVFGNPVYERAEDRDARNASIMTYRYDSIGRLVRAVCDGYSYEYEYNEQGRLKEKRSSGKRLVSYEYDKAGLITRMTDPAGVRTCYEYDVLGRLSKCSSSGTSYSAAGKGGGMEVWYEYDCLDRFVSIIYGNGVRSSYEYDADGNISRLETKKGDETLLSLAYDYDGNGNRISKVGEQKLVDGSKSVLSVQYQYDIRGQLLEEKRNGDSFRYTYDAAGNRVQKVTPEGESSYHYNEKNQLICEEGIRGKTRFTYNRQGSIIAEEEPAGTSHYSYNSKNQQIQVKREDGQTQVNRYDPEGLRYEMKENERLVRFVYHRGELLYERGKDTEVSYHLGGGIEAVQREQVCYYYHRDEQLSTALITDGEGVVENHYQYDAFGVMLDRAERIGNRMGYTGQQYDGVTGQYYLRARYYRPRLGRFLQEDAYLGDGLNLWFFRKVPYSTKQFRGNPHC